jgi:putative peptidoglycan lipid II flippase
LWDKVARLGGVVAAGGAAYFAALYLLGFRLDDFNRRETGDPLFDIAED